MIAPTIPIVNYDVFAETAAVILGSATSGGTIHLGCSAHWCPTPRCRACQYVPMSRICAVLPD